jgi:hypothetical protein
MGGELGGEAAADEAGSAWSLFFGGDVFFCVATQWFSGGNSRSSTPSSLAPSSGKEKDFLAPTSCCHSHLGLGHLRRRPQFAMRRRSGTAHSRAARRSTRTAARVRCVAGAAHGSRGAAGTAR